MEMMNDEVMMETMLRSDLRDMHGVASLPQWVGAMCVSNSEETGRSVAGNGREGGEGEGVPSSRRLDGRHLLQVDEVMNVSANARARYAQQNEGMGRCLKLALTDGVTNCVGFEMLPMPDLSVDLVAGTKLLVVDCEVRRGVLCLTPKDTAVLGGRVDALEEARRCLVERWNAPALGGRRNRGSLVEASRAAVLGSSDDTNGAVHTNNGHGNGSARADDALRHNANNLNTNATIAANTSLVPQPHRAPAAVLGARRDDMETRCIDGTSDAHTAEQPSSSRRASSVEGARPPPLVQDRHVQQQQQQQHSPMNVDAPVSQHHRLPSSSPRHVCRLVFLNQVGSLHPGEYAVKASTFNVSFSFKDRITGSILDDYMANVSLEDGTAALCAQMSQQLIRSLVGEGISPRRFGSILEGGEGSAMQERLTAHMKGPTGVIRSLQRFDGILKISISAASGFGGPSETAPPPTMANGGAKLEIIEMGDVIPRPYAWQLLNKATDAFRNTAHR